MGRYGKPEELVGAIIWLVSDAASFVNGAVIPIDGGFSLSLEYKYKAGSDGLFPSEFCI